MNHKVAISVLAEASQVLSNLKVKHWLTDGTLLGFYREKNFIGHDDDVDLGADIRDWSPEISPQMESAGFKKIGEFGSVESGLEYAFEKDEMRIDFFFFYYEGDQMWHSCWMRKIQLQFFYPEFGLKEIEFLGHPFHVPENELEYIELKYGPGWKTPQKSWHWAFSPENTKMTEPTLYNRLCYQGRWLRWKSKGLRRALSAPFSKRS